MTQRNLSEQELEEIKDDVRFRTKLLLFMEGTEKRLSALEDHCSVTRKEVISECNEYTDKAVRWAVAVPGVVWVLLLIYQNTVKAGS